MSNDGNNINSCEASVCQIINCQTLRLNRLQNEVNDNAIKIDTLLSDRCPVIIGSNASGPDTSVVLGCDAIGSNESVVVGNFATSGGNSKNVVAGYMASAPETCNVVVGHMAEALKTGGIAIGKDALVTREDGIAIGKEAEAKGLNSFSIGKGSSANGTDSVAIGAASTAPGLNSSALGSDSASLGVSSLALGQSAKATMDNSIVLNASGAPLTAGETGSLYIKPIRNVGPSGPTGILALCYDPATCEVIQLANAKLPKGICYADYLYWDTGTNQWEAGGSQVHIGCFSGEITQGTNSVAVGENAGNNNQGDFSVAIGERAGNNIQGMNSITIGKMAGETGQHDNSIVLNASGNPLNTEFTGSFYVKHVRDLGLTGPTGLTELCYDPTKCEVVQVAKAPVDFGTCQSDYLYWDTGTDRWTAGGNEVHIGCEAGVITQGTNSVAIGATAGNNNQGNFSVAIGYQAGRISQGGSSVAIGHNSASTDQGNNSVAIGVNSGATGDNTIAVGNTSNASNEKAIAVGNFAKASGLASIGVGDNTNAVGNDSVALGTNAMTMGANAVSLGKDTSGNGFAGIAIGVDSSADADRSIAIGENSTVLPTRTNSISIGQNTTVDAPMTTVINASGVGFTGANSMAFYVKPIRGAIGPHTLFYDDVSGEITYSTGVTGATGESCWFLETATGPTSGTTSGPFKIGTNDTLRLWNENGNITAQTGSVIVEIKSGSSFKGKDMFSIFAGNNEVCVPFGGTPNDPIITYSTQSNVTNAADISSVISSIGPTGFKLNYRLCDQIQELDNAGSVGASAKIQLLPGTSYPSIAYKDSDNDAIKFISSPDTQGLVWNTPVFVLGATGDIGNTIDYVIAGGCPSIGYKDSNNDLYFINADNPTGGSWTTPAVLAVGTTGTSGSSPRVLEFSFGIVSGRPAIVYVIEETFGTDDRLEYLRADDAKGTSWTGTPNVIDATGSGVGFFLSDLSDLKIISGNPAVIHRNGVDEKFYFHRAPAADGSGVWTTVDPLATAGITFTQNFSTPCLLEVSGNPAMVFWDSNDTRYKYIRATAADGSTWPAAAVNIGVPIPDLTIGSLVVIKCLIVNGRPAVFLRISLLEQGNYFYARASDALGSAWSSPSAPFPDTAIGFIDPILLSGTSFPAVALNEFTQTFLGYTRAQDINGDLWGESADVTVHWKVEEL